MVIGTGQNTDNPYYINYRSCTTPLTQNHNLEMTFLNGCRSTNHVHNFTSQTNVNFRFIFK